jgi:hypothetical protein
MPQPGDVLAHVVQQQPSLALEGPDPGEPLQLVRVEGPVRRRHPELDGGAAVGGHDLDLVDREAKVVEPPQLASDRVPVAGGESRLQVELAPDRDVALADLLGSVDRAVEVFGTTLEHGHIGEAVAQVLDQDLEVVGTLAIGQRRMDLARLGVDEEGLDPITVAPEEGVRERAVAPEDAAPMEVDEQPGHRVEQAIAVRPRAEREAR